MNLQGWNINSESLPYWNNRETMLDCRDYLYESPTGDAACLIYSVTEVGMLKYWGFCAIYKNQQAPEMALCVRYVNFAPYARFSKDGNLVFLKATYRAGVRFILVLDLKKEVYATLKFAPSNMEYDIREGDDGAFYTVFDKRTLQDDVCLAKLFHGTKIDPAHLRWRKWTALADGGDLHLQERGLRHFFRSKESIWKESMAKMRLDAISGQEFVDVNRDKILYFFLPFKTDERGHTYARPLANTAFEGRYLPAFSTREACVDYLECRGEKYVIYKARLKKLMQVMDEHYPMREWGIAIDPHHEESIAIPNTVRVTPKSLRY